MTYMLLFLLLLLLRLAIYSCAVAGSRKGITIGPMLCSGRGSGGENARAVRGIEN